MASPSKDKSQDTPPIALNKRARHEYFIEENLEAGLALQGWEVKSLRAGKAQITEGYVIVKNGEAWLIGAHVSPLKTTSTHVVADPTRTRKLLLHRAREGQAVARQAGDGEGPRLETAEAAAAEEPVGDGSG